MRIRHQSFTRIVLRFPLLCTGGTLGEFPFVSEKILKEIIAPLRGCSGPGTFETAGDGITRVTGFDGCLLFSSLFFSETDFTLSENRVVL